MGIVVLGLNHRTAPVELREQLAFSREGAANALLLFRREFPNSEAAILSTCNRVEIVVNSGDGEASVPEILRFLAQVRNVPLIAFKSHVYQVEGRQAIRQVFRVISGLDSMVLGEYQIVNQLKQAYQTAHEQGTAGPVLHRLFHHAFGVSKRVRSETTIGDGKTSISSVAVDILRSTIPDFAARRILIVGAGEMAQLAAEHLRQANATQFVITTRSIQNARILAEACGGQAVPFDQLDAELINADIVITATTCPASILTRERVARAQQARGNRPLTLIDLAVPRNIDAEAGALPGVSLHDVDGLGQVVAENRRQRASQLDACEQIVDEEVDAFEKWIAESKVRPLIEQMFEDVRALAEIEVRALYRRCPDLSDKQRDAVEQLADRLVAKLMHPCVSAVRRQSMSESASMLAEAFHTTRIAFTARSAD